MRIEPRHNLTPQEIDAVEERLYEYNRMATGCDDGQGLGFLLHDDNGKMIGAAAGYSWLGVSELKQMWIDEAHRGKGHGRALLDAFVAEARKRGVKRVWVASYSFQAPGLYESAGFERVTQFEGFPEGHVNVILCKQLQ